MPRGGVIAGTDHRRKRRAGVRRAGARAAVPRRATASGRSRRWRPPSLLGEMTDDRGAYRIFGLPPGEYIVSATPRNSSTSGDPGDDRSGDPRGDDGAAAASAAAQTPSGAGARRAAAPPPQPRDDIPDRRLHRRSTIRARRRASGAATVTLGAGEERTGVDFARAARPHGEDRRLGRRRRPASRRRACSSRMMPAAGRRRAGDRLGGLGFPQSRHARA